MTGEVKIGGNRRRRIVGGWDKRGGKVITWKICRHLASCASILQRCVSVGVTVWSSCVKGGPYATADTAPTTGPFLAEYLIDECRSSMRAVVCTTLRCHLLKIFV